MSSNTVTPYGNNLETPVPQTGWQVELDGFGLMQAQVKFRWDISKEGDFPTTFAKGTLLSTLVPTAATTYANMSLWKASMTIEKANVLLITADFAGIQPNINSGLMTNTQVVMTGATASEAIEHHPNFLVVNCPTGNPNMDKALAGFPSPSGWDDKVSTNPNRALWTPKVANQGAIQGQQFVGFLPNQTKAEYDAGNINIKAGIKNYYKPANTLRCLFYVNNETTAVGLASYVGWTTSGEVYKLPQAYKNLANGTYGGNFIYTAVWASRIRKGFLITNCSVEQYGGIYKVTADLMLSGISGWDKDIYPNLDVI